MTTLHLYSIRNMINGKQYIGQAADVRQRWYTHLSSLRRGRHHSLSLQRSFNKYGEEAFDFVVIEGPFGSTAEVNAAEERRIMTENTIAPNGYNHRAGGTYSPMSEEAKAKLSRYRKAFLAAGGIVNFKGNTHTPETKRLLSEKAIARFMNPVERERTIEWGHRAWEGEHRKCTLLNNRLGHQTERYRTSHSAKLRKGKPFPMLIDPNGIRHSVDISLSSFCGKHDLIPSAMNLVVNGKRPHHKGWRVV